MIFTNKIYKIASGKNLTLFADDKSTISVYVFNKVVTEHVLTLSDVVRCFNTLRYYSYNYVNKLNDKFLCIGFGNNLSVIEDEK